MGSLMEFPRISIITPSYNQSRFVSQTIDSVLSQDYPNLEYIVMDGGSTDNTLDILQSYGNKIKWLSERDGGQADALNKGAQMATGEIMAYLNSDDYYLPGTLHAVAKIFQENNCKWLVGDYRIVDQQNTPIQSYIVRYKKLLRGFSSYFLLSLTNFIPQPSTFWQMDLFREAGPFDTRLRFTLDYDLWMRFWRTGAPFQLSRPLAAFRIHNTSKGGSQYAMQFKEELSVLQRYNKNPVVLGIHTLSNYLISQIYRLIK
jgi:glycosyltransferase involved in cell wall biosynthesis